MDSIPAELNEERGLVALGAWLARQQFARKVGGEEAFGGDRDFYKVLGLPKALQFSDFLQLYERHDLAGRLVDLPAEDTWRKAPQVTEDGDDETEFAEAWDWLVRKRRVFAKLSTADRLSGIGRYGVLLIGMRDNKPLDEPIEEGSLQSPKDVLYLRPFHEGHATIDSDDWVEESQDERYGLPEYYMMRVTDKDTQKVHWTRCLHLAEDKGSNEAYGLPRLQRSYNAFIHKMKSVGGVAEAIWYAMRPGMAVGVKEGYDPEALMNDDDFLKEVKRYMHDPARILRLAGGEITELGKPTMLDPSGASDVILGYIAGSCGMPQRVLVGSAKGELAAAKEDLRQWYGVVSNRQKNYAEPEILRPFIDRLIWMGALPEPQAGPDAYHVGAKTPDGGWTWPALYELDDLELAEVRESKARAAKALSDPLGAYPIDGEEKRDLLGYEPREVERPEPEAMARARQNYRDGTISASQLAELVAG